MKTCPNCRAVYPNHFTVCPRDAAPLLEADDWSEGTVIRGKYRILSKVGQGGMGAVYKALHMKFDQVRALKVMTGDLAADPDFVKRFEREAVLMSRLQHPNVVRVDDIDEAEEGSPFIVMEFIEGRSLRQVIEQEGPLQPLRACSIARQAAAGLGAAHLMGMVHRDVKPENIVLVNTPAGETAKVLDFGIAKLKEAQLGDGLRTATGIVIGTAQYLSPEQSMGKRSEELDGRSDLYSLGLVMYQMLTCGLPFQADSAVGWMMARLNEPPRPIQSVRPDLAIPGALANLVMRCLEKDRDLRPADAGELIHGIERVEEEMRRPAKPVAPLVVTTPAPLLPHAELGMVAEHSNIIAPKPLPTSLWARGRRFWAGLAAIILLPFVLGPVVDLINSSMPFPAMGALVLAAFGGAGWCLTTRRHWTFRIIGLLLFGCFALLQGIRVYNIYKYMTPWGFHEAESTKFLPIDELKKIGQSPLDASPMTPGADNATQMPILKFTLQNISADALVTDWKADMIEFDADGKVLSDTEPVNRSPVQLEPGKTQPMNITGPDLGKVKSVKMVFKEVDYEVTTPAGVKEQGTWINAHFQEDLQKAKQP
jgi:serine/threonine-protein kinase